MQVILFHKNMHLYKLNLHFVFNFVVQRNFEIVVQAENSTIADRI